MKHTIDINEVFEMKDYQKAFSVLTLALILSGSFSYTSESCPGRFRPVSIFRRAISAVGSGVSMGVQSVKHTFQIAKAEIKEDSSSESWSSSGSSCGR